MNLYPVTETRRIIWSRSYLACMQSLTSVTTWKRQVWGCLVFVAPLFEGATLAPSTVAPSSGWGCYIGTLIRVWHAIGNFWSVASGQGLGTPKMSNGTFFLTVKYIGYSMYLIETLCRVGLKMLFIAFNSDQMSIAHDPARG